MSKRVLLSTGRKAEGKGNHLKDASESEAAGKANRANKKVRFSEEFQEDLYIESLKMMDKIDGLSGLSPWILKDFLSPRRPLPDTQDWFNRKGLISNTGQKKLAFYIMQKYYENKAKEYQTK